MHPRVGTSAGPSGDHFLSYANQGSTFDCRLGLIDQSLQCSCSLSRVLDISSFWYLEWRISHPLN